MTPLTKADITPSDAYSLKTNTAVFMLMPERSRSVARVIGIDNFSVLDDNGKFVRTPPWGSFKENAVYQLDKDYKKPVVKKTVEIILPITFNSATKEYEMEETLESKKYAPKGFKPSMTGPYYLGCKFKNPVTGATSEWSMTNRGCVKRNSTGLWYFTTTSPDIPAVPVMARFKFEVEE